MDERSSLNERQAAEYLGLARQSLSNRRHKRLPPPYIKIGSRISYLISDLQEFQKKNRIDPEAQDAR